MEPKKTLCSINTHLPKTVSACHSGTNRNRDWSSGSIFISSNAFHFLLLHLLWNDQTIEIEEFSIYCMMMAESLNIQGSMGR